MYQISSKADTDLSFLSGKKFCYSFFGEITPEPAFARPHSGIKSMQIFLFLFGKLRDVIYAAVFRNSDELMFAPFLKTSNFRNNLAVSDI